MSIKPDFSAILEDVLQSKEYMNFFPTLDFKLYNGSTSNIQINRVRLHIENCTTFVDPSMELGLVCTESGALCLQIFNFGWGDALNFTVDVDLSAISHKLPVRQFVTKTIPQSELKERSPAFVLVPLIEPNQLTDDDVELSIRLPAQRHASEDEHSRYEKPEGGIEAISANWSYKNSQGKEFRFKEDIDRKQRGAYDWRVISFSSGKFIYVPYDEGVRYSLIPPSVSYHALIDPDSAPQLIELSTALEVKQKSFERLYLVIGSSKSVEAKLRIELVTSTGSVLSQNANIQIWNPRNSFFSLAIQSKGWGVSQLQEFEPDKLKNLVKDYQGRKMRYDFAKLKSEPTLDWGY